MIDRPGIEARDLTVAFESQLILDRLNFTVAPGGLTGILGPSGCGKSTLLRCVADLVSPTSGTLEVHSATPDQRVAFVFQHANLLPWRDVLQNIALPLELRNISYSARGRQVRAAAKLVGLRSDDVRKFPRMLSGGMQMRVSLARSIVTNPHVLLLDEPFAALDDILRQQLNEELLRLWQAQQWTTLFVTHNVGEAVFLSQQILVLTHRPARIADQFDVPFPYPRTAELRAAPEFARLCGQISAGLRYVAS
jgi:NitT/TauT family transport system ATP-binding protein